MLECNTLQDMQFNGHKNNTYKTMINNLYYNNEE